MTDASKQALGVLRTTDNLRWYVVPILVLIIYIYVSEIERKNWSAVLLGLYSMASGWILEIVNGLVLHFTNYAPLWLTPGNSAYVIYAGWNVEIFFLAAVGGMLVIKSLPEDRDLKIVGIPNRVFIPIAWSIFAVIIEITLNRAGILVWTYKYWSWPHIYLMVIWWSVPYFTLVKMHDGYSMKRKKIMAAAGPAAAVACHLIFAVGLGWV